MNGLETSLALGINPEQPVYRPQVLFAVLMSFACTVAISAVLQTIWLQQITRLVGATPATVTAITIAYICSFAAGLLLMTWRPAGIKYSMWTMFSLQAGVSVTASAVPFLLEMFNYLYVLFFGGHSGMPPPPGVIEFLFYIASTFLVIGVPIVMTGGLLPVVANLIASSSKQPRRSILLVFSLTSVAIGTGIAAGRVLLVSGFGLGYCHWSGIILNLIICSAVLLLTRVATTGSHSHRKSVTEKEPAAVDTADYRSARDRPETENDRGNPVAGTVISAAVFMSGLALIIQTLTWMRMWGYLQGHIYGSTPITIALLFTGVAIGAGISSVVQSRSSKRTLLFPFVYVATALYTAGILLSIGQLAAAMIPDAITILVSGSAVILPPAILTGLALHQAIKTLATDVKDLPTTAVRIYLIFLMGGVTGLLIAGGLLLPDINISVAVKSAILTSLTAALLCWKSDGMGKYQHSAFLVMLLTALAIVFVADNPDAGMPMARSGSDRHEQLITYRVGPVVASVKRRDGNMIFQINGKDETSIGNADQPPADDPHKWLTALPFAMHPDAKSLLIVGLTGGAVLQGLPPVDAIDIVEALSEVIAVTQALQNAGNLQYPLDTGTKIYNSHIRSVLSLSEKSYDIIVTSPVSAARPDTAHLYTQEYTKQIHRHLNTGGIYIHGIHTGSISVSLVKSLINTIAVSFRYVRMYQTTPDLIYLVASDSAFEFEHRLVFSSHPLSSNLEYFSRLGINTPEDIFMTLLLDDPGAERFAADAKIITDDNNLFEYQEYDKADLLPAGNMAGAVADLDVMQQTDSLFHGELAAELKWAYITSRLLSRGFEERVAGLQKTITDRHTKLAVEALMMRHNGDTRAAETLLGEAINLEPADQTAAYLLVRDYLDEIATDSAPDGITGIASELRGLPHTVVQAWTNYYSQDWYGLLLYERELARAEPADPWYAEAALLRASWRLFLSSLDYHQAMVNEALRIIDRALASWKNSSLYLSRINAGLINDRPGMVLETARAAALQFEDLMHQTHGRDAASSGARIKGARDEASRMLELLEQADLGAEFSTRSSQVMQHFHILLQNMDRQILALQQGLIE